MATRTRTTRLTPEDFVDDSHAAKYLGELDTRPEVARRLLAILNDPANEQRLVDAEPAHDRPALSGVVRSVDSDDVIHQVLASGSSGYRFRQTVGVAVRLKMEKLGWATSGRKGAVPGAHYFTKAERFTRCPEIDLDYTDSSSTPARWHCSRTPRHGPARDVSEWAVRRLQGGDHFVVPELADYEVRREPLRAGKQQGIQRLDELGTGLGFHALTTTVMREAAALWARARNSGLPTAHGAALDGDVILAAQGRPTLDRALIRSR